MFPLRRARILKQRRPPEFMAGSRKTEWEWLTAADSLDCWRCWRLESWARPFPRDGWSQKKDLFLCINLTLEFKSILWLPLAVKIMTQSVGFWCVPEYFGFLPTDHTNSTAKLELHVNARLWFSPFASTGPSISFTWHAAISVWIYACLHKLRLITQARGVVGMSV